MANPDGPSEEEEAAHRAMIEKIEAFGDDARKNGLYMEGFSIGVGVSPMTPPHTHEEDEPDQTFVLATFVVGEQAFSDRVMKPEKHEEDMTFRTLTAGADPFEVLREEMRKREAEGKGPFDE